MANGRPENITVIKGRFENSSSINVNEGKKSLPENKFNRLIRKIVLSGLPLILSACASQAVITPTIEANTSTAEPTITTVATNTTTPEPDHIPKINLDFPSRFSDYYVGTWLENGQTASVSAVDGADFEANNTGYIAPKVGGAHESQFETLYTKTNPNLTAAFLIDQNFLMTYFNAETDKAGKTTGTLSDGTAVEYVNNVWVIHKDNTDLVFNPLVLSQTGQPFGYPVLCEKTTNGKTTTMLALTDKNGALVSGAKIQDAFQSAADIAKEAGYEGDLSQVFSLGIAKNGRMMFYAKDGSTITYLDYDKAKDAETVDLGNLQDPTTWPTEYMTDEGEVFNVKSYWKDTDFSTNGRPDQDLAKKQDEYFDEFVNQSMRKILETSGVENVDSLTNQQVFEQYLEWGQKNKEVVTISPQRIRGILADVNNYVVAWETGVGTSYESEMGLRSDDISYNLKYLTGINNSFKNGEKITDINIFGVTTTAILDNYAGVNGYLVALARVPGKNPEEAVIAVTAYPNYNITNTDGSHPDAYYPVVAIPEGGNEAVIDIGNIYIASDATGTRSDQFLAQAVNEGSVPAIGSSLEDILGYLGQAVFVQSHIPDEWTYIGGEKFIHKLPNKFFHLTLGYNLFRLL